MRRDGEGRTETATEYFDVVDARDRVIGRASREECHGNPALIHRAVHILVFDSRGRLFLQRRSPSKRIQPDRWDTSVGGHVAAGESWDRAAVRELEEELGVAGVRPEYLYAYLFRGNVESESTRTYTLEHDGPFRLHPEEIAEGRFWTSGEIDENLGTGLFTPNFEQEIARYRRLEKKGHGS